MPEIDLEKIPAESGPEMDPGDVLAAWEFPENIKHERNRWWYILFAVILVGFLAYSYFYKNPLFAIVLVLFVLLYIILERRQTQNIQIALTQDGIVLNNRLMEYKEFDNFYIIYYPPQIKNLYLQPKNILRQRLLIHLEDQNPAEIRKILTTYLKEDLAKEELPTSESISRILKL